MVIIKTRIFEFFDGNYRNLSELAQNMGISVSQIYRVREGKRSINQKFIIGAIRAFPKHKFEDLFYLAPESPNDTDYPRPDSINEEVEEEGQDTEQILERFTSAVEDYGQHIRSHISAIISLNDAIKEIKSSIKEADKILSYLYKDSGN